MYDLRADGVGARETHRQGRERSANKVKNGPGRRSLYSEGGLLELLVATGSKGIPQPI